MKKILIAYGDDKCAYSLRRIGCQAKRLRIFDEIRLWTPEDLPGYIKASPLMAYGYGGGYWAWKPAIIKETLAQNADGDVVCYVDAGCTLRKSVDWTLFLELMKDYDFLCFKYRDEYPQWAKYGSASTKIKHWGKKATLLFLDNWLGDASWRETNKILGGLLFFKGRQNAFVEDWMRLTLDHPEIILDPNEKECLEQYPYFALHKHDQVLLSALSYKYLWGGACAA